jgi:hypothetical protein
MDENRIDLSDFLEDHEKFQVINLGYKYGDIIALEKRRPSIT